MNVGSLFSGIGGMDHGLARAGWQHQFFCELDEWRREVLAARWPGVLIYTDVRAVGVEPTAGAAGDGRGAESDGAGRLHSDAVLDLLCGGFPCQDLSVAGRRAGLAGDRSGLFFEFARIIDAFRPGWVLIENVPGLLSSNGGRDFGTVLGTLADLGYGVGWRVLDSRFFGVPQRRRRVFIVGARADGDPRAAAERAGEILAVGSRCVRHPPAGGKAGTDVAGTLGGGAGERGWAQDTERMTFLPVAETLREHPRPGSNSNGQVVAFHATQDPISGSVSPAMGREESGAIGVSSATGVRRLTPRECERLQGLPDDWTQLGGSPDSRRYSGLGDAVTATVAEWIGWRLAA